LTAPDLISLPPPREDFHQICVLTLFGQGLEMDIFRHRGCCCWFYDFHFFPSLNFPPMRFITYQPIVARRFDLCAYFLCHSHFSPFPLPAPVSGDLKVGPIHHRFSPPRRLLDQPQFFPMRPQVPKIFFPFCFPNPLFVFTVRPPPYQPLLHHFFPHWTPNGEQFFSGIRFSKGCFAL